MRTWRGPRASTATCAGEWRLGRSSRCARSTSATINRGASPATPRRARPTCWNSRPGEACGGAAQRCGTRGRGVRGRHRRLQRRACGRGFRAAGAGNPHRVARAGADRRPVRDRRRPRGRGHRRIFRSSGAGGRAAEVGRFTAINLERVVTLHPDLVVAIPYEAPSLAALRARGSRSKHCAPTRSATRCTRSHGSAR